MKRFVRQDAVMGGAAGILVAAIVAVTGASAGATYLIALGVVAAYVAIFIRGDTA